MKTRITLLVALPAVITMSCTAPVLVSTSATSPPVAIPSVVPGGAYDERGFRKGSAAAIAARTIATDTGLRVLSQEFHHPNQWDEAARAAGIPIDQEPAVASVAHTDRGPFGHVAVIISLEEGDIFTVREPGPGGDPITRSVGLGDDFERIIHFELAHQ